MELTILMPCLNEAETVATCVRKARGFLERTGIEGEVLVADNGSSDGSPDIAREAGARVVRIANKGYGSALIGGIDAACGRFVIMADADNSYDFSQLDAFVEGLRAGNTMVIGHRFRGGIRPGAMPLLHRYLGNPLLSFAGRLFFSSGIGDFHCGLRGVDRAAVLKLGLSAPGMEFASEMVVKATLAGWRIAEVPTVLSPDGRSRAPHLRSWRDGWRHLRFLLMMSPRWLMLYPGMCLIAIGVALRAPRGGEKILDEVRDPGLRLLQLVAAALGFNLVSMQSVETVEFVAGLDVECMAKLAELRCVGFDKPARLLRMAVGDGFSESFGLSLPLCLNRVRGEFRRLGGGFGMDRRLGLLQQFLLGLLGLLNSWKGLRVDALHEFA